MAKAPPKSQDAYLHDMLEAAQLIERYMKGVGLAVFRANTEKRDAVALRLAVMGESAHKIERATAKALFEIPFDAIRGLRNRIAHDYGAIDFHIVWKVARTELKPIIRALKNHLRPGRR